MRCAAAVIRRDPFPGAPAGHLPAWLAATLEAEFGERAEAIGLRWLARFQGQVDEEEAVCRPCATWSTWTCCSS